MPRNSANSSFRDTLQRAWRQLKPGDWQPRNVALVALLCLAIFATVSWGARLALAPARRAGPHVRLDSYGYPGIELSIVYPVRISSNDGSPETSILTVYARADAPSPADTLELVLPLPDESLAFVDTQGLPVPGRLRITPGYPDAIPYSLLLRHANTQLQPSLLFARMVRVMPMLHTPEGIVEVPELAFRTSLESPLGQSLRLVVNWLSGWGLLIAAILAAMAPAWAWAHQAQKHRFLAREQQLSALYTRLRDEIKVENWSDARARVEEIRLLAPSYRDLDRLDTLISTAETAAWRREQLYSSGLRAYRERDWPTAVGAFQRVEQETPYYRDVRFLRRTAALYADLRSRDRSLRVRAARELGEVADLIDMLPLLQALGDRSREVAEAAEASFARIGMAAADTLVAGLTAESLPVREASFRLLQSFGQNARETLQGALHSPDVRITSAAARLLRNLGATEELAEALLWSGPEHHAGIVAALVQEGQAACEILVDTLLQAPPGREQTLIAALGALKTRVDISRYLETRLRSASDPRAKDLLQRALKAPAQPFASADLSQEAVDLQQPEPVEEATEPAEDSDFEPSASDLTPRSLIQRLGWFERRQR